MTLEDRIVRFIETYGPDEPFLRTAFIDRLRALMEEYGRNAIIHGNLPDTEHPHRDMEAENALLRAERDAHLETLDDRNKLLIKFQELQRENARLLKALFVFAELPTTGWDDAVDPDVEHEYRITNRMILEARAAYGKRSE